jgi:hypothetical protein
MGGDPTPRAQLQPSQIGAPAQPAQHALDRLSAAAFVRRRAIGHVRVISERGIRSLAVGYVRGVKPGAGRLRVTPSRLRGGSADFVHTNGADQVL